MAHKFSIVASPIHKVSSAYWRIEIGNLSLPTSKALKHPHSTADLISAPKPSATIRKRRGASGSPCFKPLLIFISSVGHPLTNTDMLPEQIHALIHSLHFNPNPNRCNM
jgi:hypothetical protein